MEKYQNLNGNSGVDSYEIHLYSIDIKFTHGNCIYTYDYNKPGEIHVEKMKELAEIGAGLSAYIGKIKKDNYADKRC